MCWLLKPVPGIGEILLGKVRQIEADSISATIPQLQLPLPGSLELAGVDGPFEAQGQPNKSSATKAYWQCRFMPYPLILHQNE